MWTYMPQRLFAICSVAFQPFYSRKKPMIDDSIAGQLLDLNSNNHSPILIFRQIPRLPFYTFCIFSDSWVLVDCVVNGNYTNFYHNIPYLNLYVVQPNLYKPLSSLCTNSESLAMSFAILWAAAISSLSFADHCLTSLCKLWAATYKCFNDKIFRNNYSSL